jgi:hypothetical protein
MTNPVQVDKPVFEGDPFGKIKTPAINPRPLPQEVAAFHSRADTDASPQAIHHTLGIKNGQASPGDHRHNGLNSKRIGEGITVTGSKGGNAALASLMTALVQILGITDSTT